MSQYAYPIDKGNVVCAEGADPKTRSYQRLDEWIEFFQEWRTCKWQWEEKVNALWQTRELHNAVKRYK